MTICTHISARGFHAKVKRKNSNFYWKEKEENKDVYNVKKYGSGSYLMLIVCQFHRRWNKGGFCET